MAYNGKIFQTDGSSLKVSARIEQTDNVKIVYTDWITEKGKYLDPDRSAEIVIELSDGIQYMANHRHTEFWCRPSFGTDPRECPEETQYFLYKKSENTWGVIVPVVSDDYKCVLEGTDHGLCAVLFSWCRDMTACRSLAFVTAEGSDPYALTEECVKTALSHLNNGCVTREKRRYPEVFEYLGWCSWDALQIRVSEDGLIEKCNEFKRKGIPVKWAIIDDMWAEIAQFNGAVYNSRNEMFDLMHSSSMYNFEASYTRFPQGLEHAVTRMHEYGMKVGIWHPTTGYWFGLDPDGVAYKKLADYTYTAPEGEIIADWHETNAFNYFNTMHRFFRACGADFLKVDNQSMTNRFYRYSGTVGKVTHDWHRGLEASVGLNFDNTMINCMGMASEDIWNRPFSSISRCSDDFQPEDRPWFTKHILQCTYNSIFQGQFYWNDYDMWWTDDTQAEKNSLLRAVSGGPIYVSDEIGRSRPEILKPLAFEDGRILRCDRSGMPTPDCLTIDPETAEKPLKIQNITSHSGGTAGVVAAFNITREQNEVSGTICSADVPGLCGDKFAVYEYFTGECHIVNKGETIPFTLKNIDDYRLFVIVPYINNYAAIGMIDKMIAPAGIIAEIGESVRLYESGRFAFIKDGKLHIETREA